MGRALKNPVQSGPWSIWLGQQGLQMVHNFRAPSLPKAQQPQNSQPFDSPLMPHKDPFHPAARNVCPPQSVPPPGGSQ